MNMYNSHDVTPSSKAFWNIDMESPSLFVFLVNHFWLESFEWCADKVSTALVYLIQKRNFDCVFNPLKYELHQMHTHTCHACTKDDFPELQNLKFACNTSFFCSVRSFWKCVFLFSIVFVLVLFKYFPIVFIAAFNIKKDTDWINPSSSVNKTLVQFELKKKNEEKKKKHEGMSERDIMTLVSQWMSIRKWKG